MARRGQSLTEPSLWDQPRTEHRAPPGPEATDQRLLVFPQGKEEMCKEEVVESESRHIDLQKEPPRAACECAGQVAWNGRDMGRQGKGLGGGVPVHGVGEERDGERRSGKWPRICQELGHLCPVCGGRADRVRVIFTLFTLFCSIQILYIHSFYNKKKKQRNKKVFTGGWGVGFEEAGRKVRATP